LGIRSERFAETSDAQQLTIYSAEEGKRVIVRIAIDWIISIQIKRRDLAGWNE
jgi:hypothetical protein